MWDEVTQVLKQQQMDSNPGPSTEESGALTSELLRPMLFDARQNWFCGGRGVNSCFVHHHTLMHFSKKVYFSTLFVTALKLSTQFRCKCN